MHDYLLVGAGLFNAVFAHEARKAGKRCLVIDKRNHIGGNCYTEKIKDITVHKYGAHIFRTNDKNVWEYINQFAEFNNFINSPIANYNGEIYNLPFNMNTFSKMWDISTPEEAKEIIKKQSSNINNITNLEEHAISLVGTDIYEKLIRGYTEKQWGRKCKDLPISIMRRIPVRYTYDNNYFNDRYQGIPIGGYTPIINKMFMGCDIELGVDFVKNREKYQNIAKKIIYTGPIDEYYEYKLGTLEYRSLKFEEEMLNVDNYQGVAVVNYTDVRIPFTRIIEHKHFEFGKQEYTYISKEYPIKWNIGMECYYPINDDRNNNLYDKYVNLAYDEKVIFAGRLGSYSYTDMQDTIKNSLSLFNCLKGE